MTDNSSDNYFYSNNNNEKKKIVVTIIFFYFLTHYLINILSTCIIYLKQYRIIVISDFSIDLTLISLIFRSYHHTKGKKNIIETL